MSAAEHAEFYDSLRQKNQTLHQTNTELQTQLTRMRAQISRMERETGRGEPELASSMRGKNRPKHDPEMEAFVKSLQERNDSLQRELEASRRGQRMAHIGAKPASASARKPGAPSAPTRRANSQATLATPASPSARSAASRGGVAAAAVGGATMSERLAPGAALSAWGVLDAEKAEMDRKNMTEEEKRYYKDVVETLERRVAMGGEGEEAADALRNPRQGQPGLDAELHRLRAEMREKRAKIAMLSTQFEHLSASFRAEKELQRRALDQCEQYKAQLQKAQIEVRTLQRQIQTLEMNGDQVEALQVIIKDLRAENRALTDRIALLTSNAMESDQAEAQRLKKVVAEYTASIHKLRKELDVKTGRVGELEAQTKKMLEKQMRLQQDLSAEKTDRAAAESKLRKAMDRARDLEERVSLFAADAGVDRDDLERALDIARRERDDPSRLALLEGAGKLTMAELRRQMQELEITNKNLLLELQQQQSVNDTQLHLMRQKSTEAEAQQERLKELARRVERGRSPRHAGKWEEMSDASLFTNPETELGDLGERENLIVLRVLRARLDPKFPMLAAGGSTPPVTFLTCDFFDFETQNSGLFGGFEPEFAFTAQYRVEVDAFLLSHMERQPLVVELYRHTQGAQPVKLGTCLVPLKPLLEKAAASGGARVEGVVKIVNAEAAKGVVGEITFMLRMLRPLASVGAGGSPRAPTPRAAERGDALGEALRSARAEDRLRASFEAREREREREEKERERERDRERPRSRGSDRGRDSLEREREHERPRSRSSDRGRDSLEREREHERPRSRSSDRGRDGLERERLRTPELERSRDRREKDTARDGKGKDKDAERDELERERKELERARRELDRERERQKEKERRDKEREKEKEREEKEKEKEREKEREREKRREKEREKERDKERPPSSHSSSASSLRGKRDKDKDTEKERDAGTEPELRGATLKGEREKEEKSPSRPPSALSRGSLKDRRDAPATPARESLPPRPPSPRADADEAKEPALLRPKSRDAAAATAAGAASSSNAAAATSFGASQPSSLGATSKGAEAQKRAAAFAAAMTIVTDPKARKRAAAAAAAADKNEMLPFEHTLSLTLLESSVADVDNVVLYAHLPRYDVAQFAERGSLGTEHPEFDIKWHGPSSALDPEAALSVLVLTPPGEGSSGRKRLGVVEGAEAGSKLLVLGLAVLPLREVTSERDTTHLLNLVDGDGQTVGVLRAVASLSSFCAEPDDETRSVASQDSPPRADESRPRTADKLKVSVTKPALERRGSKPSDLLGGRRSAAESGKKEMGLDEEDELERDDEEKEDKGRPGAAADKQRKAKGTEDDAENKQRRPPKRGLKLEVEEPSLGEVKESDPEPSGEDTPTPPLARAPARNRPPTAPAAATGSSATPKRSPAPGGSARLGEPADSSPGSGRRRVSSLRKGTP